MPYTKPTFAEVWHGGLVKVRFDLLLMPDDARYDDPKFHVIDWNSREAVQGYSGLVDENGDPLDLEEYLVWESKLPKIWLPDRKFHSHILRFEPDVSQDAILQEIEPHIPNFYRAWTEELDKIPGGMRRGWDIATRWRALGRPRRYDQEMTPSELQDRKTACQSKVNLIVANAESLQAQSSKIGEIFPSTEIDVGSAAINRSGNMTLYSTAPVYNTILDYNNAANETGALDTVEAYMNAAAEGNSIKFGTFTDNGSASFTCNDAEEYGEVAVGSNSCTGLDIDVTSGEFIGCDARAAASLKIDRAYSGGGGVYYEEGQYCDPSDTQTFTNLMAGDILSLYGEGETPPVTFIPTVTII